MEPFIVWLYGSHARGCTDSYSDLDLLVVSDFQVGNDCIYSKISILSDTANISHYSWAEIHQMADYGSLFLHHLKMEALPLYESPNCKGRLREKLENLGDYKLAKRDVRGFQRVLEDVSKSLNSGNWIIYDLAVLGSLVRHSSILGCYLLNQPRFGRYSAVTNFVQLSGLSQSIKEEFLALYQYRLYIEKRSKKPDVSFADPFIWIERSHEIIRKLEVLVDAKYK
ncbi:MAG: nucleotidyltransferase domain-containing protein [Gammaproteobacteria bacterium]|nr:nucleotidyltransferase domain-containing protein [Gammaproteobacteria bacterium]